MPTINILSDHLISQIAAGEVVERPASVLKELVENSLDAGAHDIRVSLEAGGKRRIVVEDDGAGMDPSDALLAFDRHATSKIASFDDLEQVATLGFRGEALASIAAVARVELTTALGPGEGHRVRIEGGRIKVSEPIARPRGTSLEVASLFFNVPARRKFLKTPQTEMRRAVEVVQGYALARPDVRFRVEHEGRTLLDALAEGDDSPGRRRRIGQLFGDRLAENLVDLPESHRKHTGERITGFVGNAETTRGRRTFVFVNGRLLRDRQILAVFYRAVREEWKSDKFPALFLFLEVPADEVDVNVHPQKAEVRFRDRGFVRRVADALHRGLAQARGEEDAPLRTPAGPLPGGFGWQGLGERPLSSGGAGGESQTLGQGWVVREAGQEGAQDPSSGESWLADQSATAPSGGRPELGQAVAPGQVDRLAAPRYAPIDRPTVPLSGRSGPARPFRLLGQYKGTLILLEGPDGLYLIDQHVAHERILYERLRRTMARESTPAQSLLTPAILDVAPAERLRLLESASGLDQAGFGVTEVSGEQVGLTSVPAVLSADEGEKLLLQLASGKSGTETPEALEVGILDALAASLACKAAVKMHHPLTPHEMEALVAELFVAEQPYACPHGRPIVLKMTDADLERRFGRR